MKLDPEKGFTNDAKNEQLADSSSTEKGSREKSPQRSLWARRTIAGVALAAVTAGVYGGYRLVDNVFFAPGQERASDEATLLEEVRSGEREMSVEPALVLLRSGTHIRETPHMASGPLGTDNISERLNPGTNLIIDYPAVYTDEQNQTWYGFREEASVSELVDPEESSAATSHEIAEDMFWVNTTSLNVQERDDGSAYVEHLFGGEAGDQLAQLDSRGNLTARQDGDTPIAVGRHIADDVAEFFIRSSSR